jgi:hypothetical protein
VSAQEGQSTGTFNSLVFHLNSAVDFGFIDISETVPDVSIIMTVCDGGEGGSKLLPLYTSTLLLVRVSQKNK